MSLFEINNVRKSFGDLTVLHDISVKVDEGEVVAIIGPSGSGKSTLLRCATMLETMDSGELIYLDEKAAHNDPAGHTAYASPADLRRIKGYFGLVFQNFNLFPHFSVMRNLTEAPIHVQKRERGEVEKEARELIRKMGLEGKENYYPQQLSGGQQQRVALARALVLEPGVLLFDEPLSNLDAKLRVTMRTEIRRIQQEAGITAIYVTHDQSEAMALSDQIIIMEKGVVAQIGTPQEIYYHPASEFVADFIGEANFLRGTLTSKNGDNGVVTVEGTPVDVVGASEMTEGGACTLVLRPESAVLADQGQLPCKVILSCFMGSYQNYHVMVGDTLVKITDFNPKNKKIYQVGDTAWVAFEKESLHLL